MKYKDTIQVLKTLTMARGVSGYEKIMGVSAVIKNELQKSNARVSVDYQGNVLAAVGKGQKRILIEAHMDEVGICITNQMKQKSYQFVSIGGTDPFSLLNQEVELLVEDQWIKGKFVTNKLHPTSLSQFTINIDGNTEIPTGTVGVFRKFFKQKGTEIQAVGLDNKVGCATLIRICNTIQLPKNTTVYFAFTVQEEQGQGYGAYSVAKKLQPDVAVVIDSAYAQPYPNSSNWKIPVLGKGPAIQLIGTGFVMQGNLVEKVKQIAETNQIPYQFEIPDRNQGATNVKAIQLASPQTETIGINIPVRDQDTPRTAANINDVENTMKLIEIFINEKTIERR